MTSRFRRAGRGLGLLALALGPGIGLADTIHLRGGGAVRTSDWWIEGDVLRYREAAGIIGLPVSIVLRIDPDSDPGPARPVLPDVPTAPAPSGAPPAPAPSDSTAGAEAYRALERGDFETAARLYQRVLHREERVLVAPRVGYAMSQIALGEDALALGAVLDGLAREPENPLLLELLGDLRDREERVDDALLAWREAFEHRPSERLEQKISRAERELAAGRRYAFSPSSHFNLRYDDGKIDETLAAALIEELEQIYWLMVQTFDHTPRQPITVVLYPTRQFRDVTGAPEWVGGLYDGKIRVPLGGLTRIDPEARRVLVHEVTHAFVHSKTRGQCPRWLHEGLAQRSEGHRPSRAEKQQVLQRLRQGQPESWESSGFSYPLAFSLTAHLESMRGFHAVLELLDRLGAGEELETALVAIYGDGYGRICREWARAALGQDSQ